jgi:hypothetical protein
MDQDEQNDEQERRKADAMAMAQLLYDIYVDQKHKETIEVITDTQ